MDFKQQKKIFGRAVARYSMFFTIWLVRHMSMPMVQRVADFVSCVSYRLTRKHVRIAKTSMRTAFGDSMTEEEINKTTRKCFDLVSRNIVEMTYFLEHLQEINQYVTIEGTEHLDAAFAKGKGIVAVTGHFGNFSLLMLYFAQNNYDTHTIMRPMRDEKMEKFLARRRKEVKLNTVHTLPRRKSVMDSLKALRQNGILFIPIDQNFGAAGGVFVDFFGQKAATATGPVVFALRTGAPILPIFIHRTEDNKHKIVVEPPMSLDTGETEEETLILNTQKITTIIESYVRRYPHEWGWMHKRWKSRPKEEEEARRAAQEKKS